MRSGNGLLEERARNIQIVALAPLLHAVLQPEDFFRGLLPFRRLQPR